MQGAVLREGEAHTHTHIDSLTCLCRRILKRDDMPTWDCIEIFGKPWVFGVFARWSKHKGTVEFRGHFPVDSERPSPFRDGHGPECEQPVQCAGTAGAATRIDHSRQGLQSGWRRFLLVLSCYYRPRSVTHGDPSSDDLPARS